MHAFSATRRTKPRIVKSSIDTEDEETENVFSGGESLEVEDSTSSATRQLNQPPPNVKRSSSKLKLSFGMYEVPFISKYIAYQKGSGRRHEFHSETVDAEQTS